MGEAADEQNTLRGLLQDTHAVLLDFDGPVTRLFGGASTEPVAREIKETVSESWGTLDHDVEACNDSHGVLLAIRDMYDRPAPVPRDPKALLLAEAIVTRYEYEAVRSALPTPHLEELVSTLHDDLKLPLAIVSNNSDGPVWEFLKNLGLQSKFATVVGRDPSELRRMKPDPSSVKRAVRELRELRHLDLAPSSCLLVGDQLTDLEAAGAAGTRFLGYTSRAEREAGMLDRGADWVLSSHDPLITAAKELLNAN